MISHCDVLLTQENIWLNRFGTEKENFYKFDHTLEFLSNKTNLIENSEK